GCSSRRDSKTGWSCWHHRRTRLEVASPPDDDPVRALLLVQIEPLAVIAAHALRLDNPGALNGAPLAGLLADLARLAFRPALDPKHRQVRQQAEERADRAQKPAVQISHEDRRDEQRPEADPQRDRRFPREHPE